MSGQARAPLLVVVVVTVVGLVALRGGGARADAFGKLANRYDYINLDILFNSKRLFSNYIDCMMGKKHCPPEGRELKKYLPDLLNTRCTNCTARQRDILVKITMRMEEDFPQQLEVLRKKWDPTGQQYAMLKVYMEKTYPDEMQKRAIRAANKQKNDELQASGVRCNVS